jgi:glycosyltransferase involved in cell wall biosynthesis/Tfp pilus assembly protein PilF
MSKISYLLFHKDHPLHPQGVNSGAEMATRSLARFLAKAGKTVVVCGEIPAGDCNVDGVAYWDIGATFDVNKALVRARTLGPYHLLSAGRAYPILAAQQEAACLSTTLICHDPSGTATGINNRALSTIADRIICVSQAQRELFIQNGADPGSVVVIPNGVDLERFSPPASSTIRDPHNIIFVGALVPHKGAHVIIETFARLKTKFPQATLDLYGGASLWGGQEYLNAEAITAQIPGVTFHGVQSQDVIIEALRRATCAVCPSIWFEALGLASLEAQATGCPVVAFDSGGLRETMLPDETGILVKSVDSEALEGAVARLLSDVTLARRMGERAASWIRSRFSWERVAQSVVSLCEHPAAPSSRIALMSTWNQQCGLATYAQFLFSELPQEYVTIFGEELEHGYTDADASNVLRTWNRANPDLSRVEEGVLRAEAQILHLNFHDHQFYPHETLFGMIERLRARGVKVIAHLHTTYTEDARFSRFVQALDGIIVHAEENALQVIAHGAPPESVHVLPHGVLQREPYTDNEKLKIRAELRIPEKTRAVVSVGFVQPNKGMEGVIEAVAHLRSQGRDAHGYILGKVQEKLPYAVQYYEQLQSLATRAGVEKHITFVNKFLSEDEVSKYLGVADLVIMNYQSQYYEASGACALAIGAGCLVATSLAPQFSPFGDAVWHMTSGFPAGISARLLLGDDPTLRRAIQERALRYAGEHAWPVVAQRLKKIYEVLVTGASVCKEAAVVERQDPRKNLEEKCVTPNTLTKPIRVLFQNRANTFTQRGGDTVVMERLRDGLEKRGISVTIDLECREDPKGYNLVHLFNFALPDMVRRCGEQAHRAGVPFVVTTLYEDVPTFHNQSWAVGRSLIEYQAQKQQSSWWRENRVDTSTIARSGRFENTWTAEHAAMLFTNGHEESRAVRRDYPKATRCREVFLGCVTSAQGDPKLFEKEYGVKDFVLCVGRLETRKNQLMLLKALEQSECTVVLAAGGFSYQPEYERAVSNFKRKGRTIILGRISDEMLASAYAAAKVHALPSWYELPGLVSLEAALQGCNLVVTDRGTTADYLDRYAYYCNPADERTIYAAVTAAMCTPQVSGLREHVQQFTWERTIEETVSAYNEVIMTTQQNNKSIATTNPLFAATHIAQTAQVTYDLSSSAVEFQEALEQGEIAAKARDFTKAQEYLAKAESIDALSVRVLRCRGAVYLAEGRPERALPYFERAIALDAGDMKSACGAGMCEIMEKKFEKAYERFEKIVVADPDQQVALLQLMECSYALNRFDALERALRIYTSRHQDDTAMQYCFAGCLLRTGDIVGAERVVTDIEKRAPEYKGLAELKEAIAKERERTKMQQHVAPQSSLTLEQKVTLEQELEIERELSEMIDHKRAKNYEQVRDTAERLLKMNTLTSAQRERAVLFKAESLVMAGALDEARALYQDTLQKNPDSARALCGIGALTAHAGAWEEAEQLFKRARSLDEQSDVALAGLGVVAVHYGKQQDAWSLYEQALARNPENVRALLGLIEVGYPLARLSEVQKHLEAYLELHPADLEFVYSLAGCCFAQGLLKETLRAIDRIILFNPAHEKALELKEMVRNKMQYTEVRPAV